MKYKKSIISASVIIAMLMGILLPTINVFAESIDSASVITGTYQFKSNAGTNTQNTNTFEYRDDCFTRSSFLGCKHLEILSIQAASASASYYEEKENNTSENAHNITEMLKSMKFNNVKTNKYYTAEKKENSMAVAVGTKNIVQNGKTYTLIAIIPRSADYKQEWAGNFIVGDGKIHEGFKQARDEILRYVKKYIQDNNIKGNLKVWTAGWSRGGAVSNMIGGFFAGGGIEYFENSVNITPEDVYCYTIGSPMPIKDGADKNVELSVSSNRAESEYANDTEGSAFEYKKGGTVNSKDAIYNGIRSIISPTDAFTLVAPKIWGFARYGKDISSDQGLVSEKAMLEELNKISKDVYNLYTENGNTKQFKRKTFDFKTLSLVDGDSVTTPAEFIAERLKVLANQIKTYKAYKEEHYQDVLKSIAGIYGMLDTYFKNGNIIKNINQKDIANILTYTVLAYVSEYSQKAEIANSEDEAITIALEQLLTYITGESIDNATFTIDDFIALFAKFMSDNENKPISNAVISGIISIVPKDKVGYLDAFKGFVKKDSDASQVTTEQGLKAFIKACYYGADSECEYGSSDYYKNPLNVRNILCLTMVIALSSDIPEIATSFADENSQITGKALKFEDAIGLILKMMRTEKDENGNVIKIYENLSELSNDKMADFLNDFLGSAISESEELYGKEYKNELLKKLNTLKENINTARKIFSTILLYSDKGLDFEDIIQNVSTIIANGMSIPVAHYHEIYLAKARTSNRYEDHFTKPAEETHAHTYVKTIEKAKLNKNGSIIEKCACGYIKSKTTIVAPKTIKLKVTSYKYDGNAKKPAVIVTDSKGKTIGKENYTVSYNNNKKIGTATAIVTFKGNYEGKKELKFTINPKGTSLKSLIAGKKQFKATWNKQTTQTTGYQIQYSTNKNFKSGNKTSKVMNNKTISRIINNLKAKKKYYVRIRTYKTVNSKDYFSGWSNAKNVTTKK